NLIERGGCQARNLCCGLDLILVHLAIATDNHENQAAFWRIEEHCFGGCLGWHAHKGGYIGNCGAVRRLQLSHRRNLASVGCWCGGAGYLAIGGVATAWADRQGIFAGW